MVKQAIVSGSDGGIGQATMKLLEKRGYKTHGLDIVKEPKNDITRSLERWFQERFNPVDGSLKIIVNCAGITRIDGVGWGAKNTLRSLREVFEVNFFGAMNVCIEANKYMKRGAIINVASKSAKYALINRLGYCSSKGALVSATRQMARDLAPRITANSISPGIIDTRMKGSIVSTIETASNLVKRKGRPEEVARLICDVAENPYITGQDYIIDGGYTAI